MSKHHKIDYLEFPACDLEATQAFFERLLAWQFQSYGPDYLDFNDGVLSGGFYRSELKSRVEQGATLLVLYSEDLEQSYKQVLECGGRISQEIFSFPGGRRFHFIEPSGNELAMWQREG